MHAYPLSHALCILLIGWLLSVSRRDPYVSAYRPLTRLVFEGTGHFLTSRTATPQRNSDPLMISTVNKESINHSGATHGHSLTYETHNGEIKWFSPWSTEQSIVTKCRVVSIQTETSLIIWSHSLKFWSNQGSINTGVYVPIQFSI